MERKLSITANSLVVPTRFKRGRHLTQGLTFYRYSPIVYTLSGVLFRSTHVYCVLTHLHIAPHYCNASRAPTLRCQIPHLWDAAIISLGGVTSLLNHVDAAWQELLQLARPVQRDDDAPDGHHGAGPAVCHYTTCLCPLRAFFGLC